MKIVKLVVVVLAMLLVQDGEAVGFSKGSVNRRLTPKSMNKKNTGEQKSVSGNGSRQETSVATTLEKGGTSSQGGALFLPAGLDEDDGHSKSSCTQGQKVLSAEGLSIKDNIKIEYGEGHGETFDEALKEAMKDVLQKVVGVYVDSDFRMNNDEIIKDEIITHSNGFIDHYKKMDEADDTNGRGKVVTIKAWVKMRDFVNRMKKMAPRQKINVDGVLIDTHLENDVNAEALLRKELETIDPASLMDIRLLESFRPEVVAVDEDVVTMRYLYVVRYSNEQYYRGFLPRLKSVLNQIAIKKDTNGTLSFSVVKIGMYPRPISSVSNPYSKESWKERPQSAYICVTHLPVWDGEHDKKTVAVMDKINKGGVAMLTRWKLSERHISVFCDSMKSFVSKQAGLRCVFSLFDENNNVVSRIAVPVDREALFGRVRDKESIVPDFMPLLPNSGIWYRAMSSETYHKVISLHKSGVNTDAVDRFVGYVDIKVEKADVKKIKSAEIKLETNNEGGNE